MKESTRQQLRSQLDLVEKETRAKMQEMDAFNTQLKVGARSHTHSNAYMEGYPAGPLHQLCAVLILGGGVLWMYEGGN